MSHEMRTPLFSVLGFIDLINEEVQTFTIVPHFDYRSTQLASVAQLP
jgi:signal transduction histidine kinase